MRREDQHRRSRPERLCWSIFVFCLVCTSCLDRREPPPSSRLSSFPRVILWAWERPENLTIADPEKYGVAFLAQTLVLSNGEVMLRPRRQPLQLPEGMKLIAVTRIESQKNTGAAAGLNDEQRRKIVELVARTLELKNVSGIQIDFDVLVSERTFYRDLLSDLRQKLPENIPLSITSLASFCLGDRWMKGLPIDEAVPMIFRMGTDDPGIKQHLAAGGDFREPLCKTSYGISLDEPLKIKFDYTRRTYVFNPHPWTRSDIERVETLLNR